MQQKDKDRAKEQARSKDMGSIRTPSLLTRAFSYPYPVIQRHSNALGPMAKTGSFDSLVEIDNVLPITIHPPSALSPLAAQNLLFPDFLPDQTPSSYFHMIVTPSQSPVSWTEDAEADIFDLLKFAEDWTPDS